MEEPKTKRTRWHRLLGKLLEELLKPVNILVYTDFPIMSEPPKSDILLLKKEGKEWEKERKALLPDGIRESGKSESCVIHDHWLQFFVIPAKASIQTLQTGFRLTPE